MYVRGTQSYIWVVGVEEGAAPRFLMPIPDTRYLSLTARCAERKPKFFRALVILCSDIRHIDMLSVCRSLPAVGIPPKFYGFAIVNTWIDG